MALPLKTPTNRRGRDPTKAVLAPSRSGVNTVSPTKPRSKSTTSLKPAAGDITNPFIATPRDIVSPVKRSTSGAIVVTEALQRQANTGVIRKGGVESRINVITNDYVPPPPAPKPKRSKSSSSLNSRGDRFITTTRDVDDVASTLELMHLNPVSSSPGHTARLAAATGVPLNKRVLAYHEPPPASSSDTTLAKQRELARPLYARPGALASNTDAVTSKARKIATQPERVLDAPGMLDDFYLNLLSWSCTNIVAVALGEHTYIWRAETGEVSHLAEAPAGSYVSSVDFSNDGAFLGIGLGSGAVELWDVEAGTRLRSMAGHQAQIATLAWTGHVLSSGCGDGSIWHHDVRIARHKVMELLGHSGEVCGLRWRADGELLASGGNDNVVNIWDGRLGDVGEGARGVAKWTKRNHTAAVKAIAWCPWQSSLLASGGGTNDATINVWNSTTGARLHTLRTPAQVTSLQWAPHRKEILSTHGYPTNALMVHAYPSLERVAEIRDAHDARVLFSAVGPAGDMVVSGAGDENLKFWRIWEVPKVKAKKDAFSSGTGATNAGIMSIR